MTNLKFILVIVLIVSCCRVWAIEPRAQLNILTEETTLKEGDIVEGVLKIWPLENVDFGEFTKLQNSIMANSYYVSEIEKSSLSENNADVVEIKMLLIVKPVKEAIAKSIAYKGHAIEIQAPEIKIASFGSLSKDYFIVDQSVSKSHLVLVLVGIVILFLLLIVFIFRSKIKIYLNKFQKDPKAQLLTKYREMFLDAKLRQDYELIYMKRMEWLTLLPIQTAACNDFFSTMEKHQYKKEWSVEELNEVEAFFDYLRGSFK